MEEERQQDIPVQGTYTNNMGYTGESIIKIRLDTQQLLNQIESFLRGQQIVIQQNDDGMFIEKTIKLGKPLANDKGVHALLSFVAATINAQTVQGNYEWDTWREEVAWCREQLATDVFVNHDDWGISPTDISLICNTVMNMIKPFLTRLVHNEERKSYANYQETRTVATPPQKGMLAKIFG